MLSLWNPKPDSIVNSQMTRFMDYVRDRFTLSLSNYAALYQWSINYPEDFWAVIWDFCQVIASQRWHSVLEHHEKMPGAQWFTGAKLNFAENLLSFVVKNNDKTEAHHHKSALIFFNENGTRRVLTYGQLYQQVAKLAA